MLFLTLAQKRVFFFSVLNINPMTKVHQNEKLHLISFFSFSKPSLIFSSSGYNHVKVADLLLFASFDINMSILHQIQSSSAPPLRAVCLTSIPDQTEAMERSYQWLTSPVQTSHRRTIRVDVSICCHELLPLPSFTPLAKRERFRRKRRRAPSLLEKLAP